MSRYIGWGVKSWSPLQQGILERLRAEGYSDMVCQWSRQYEYPWVLANGVFQKGQWVLDAGGGSKYDPMQYVLSNMGCKVVNLDIDAYRFPNDSPALCIAGDIIKMHNIPAGSFDRVICLSVLEHIKEGRELALAELLRVLKPGGRLLVTFDVAGKAYDCDNPDWCHYITPENTHDLVECLEFSIPSPPPDVLYSFMAGPPEKIPIRVLCLYLDKE